MSEGLTGKEDGSCGLRQTQVRRSQFSRGRLATHLVSVASSPGFFVSRAFPDHSSGANALISGVMKMLALYFGTDSVTFTVTARLR